MNWDAISGIAELVGAAGVIVSLIYVGIQIRQNTLTAQASNFQQWADTQVHALRALTDDPGVTQLVDHANENFESLTTAELLRLQMIPYNHFTQWDVAFTNAKHDLMDTSKWQLVARGYEFMMQNTPAFRRMWEYSGHVYDEDFRLHVDSIVADSATSSATASGS